MIAVLCGGVGAARFLAGLVSVVAEEDVTAVVNTGDDTELHGLSISPDLDTVTYTLSGRVNRETGWGLAGDTFKVMSALEGLGGESWFRLGDMDLATHMYRTERLRQGSTLSSITAELASSFGLGLHLIPMSDDPVRTRLRLEGGDEVGFQEYFVKLRHDVAVAGVTYAGASAASPAPGVLESLGSAQLVVIAPSNPVLSIDPILAVPGIREVLRSRRDAVVAVSPIVAGAALKGPAARLLTELGGTASAAGVGRWLHDVCGTLVVDVADRAAAREVEEAGVRCAVAETVMSSPAVAAALAESVMAAGAAAGAAPSPGRRRGAKSRPPAH